MVINNLDAEGKKQLIEFYKAMKMACRMFAGKGGAAQQAIIQLADQIIVELKKETPDEEKVKSLAEKLQYMASNSAV